MYIFLKIRNSYFHGTPLSASFCFIAFSQMCKILTENFSVQPIVQLPGFYHSYPYCHTKSHCDIFVAWMDFEKTVTFFCSEIYNRMQ